MYIYTYAYIYIYIYIYIGTGHFLGPGKSLASACMLPSFRVAVGLSARGKTQRKKKKERIMVCMFINLTISTNHFTIIKEI